MLSSSLSLYALPSVRPSVRVRTFLLRIGWPHPRIPTPTTAQRSTRPSWSPSRSVHRTTRTLALARLLGCSAAWCALWQSRLQSSSDSSLALVTVTAASLWHSLIAQERGRWRPRPEPVFAQSCRDNPKKFQFDSRDCRRAAAAAVAPLQSKKYAEIVRGRRRRRNVIEAGRGLPPHPTSRSRSPNDTAIRDRLLAPGRPTTRSLASDYFLL